MPGFLAKTGLDSIKIGSHKVPIALIGGVAALAGVFLVLRARQSKQQVATVGTPAANSGVNPAVGYSGGNPAVGMDSAMLANLSQQLTGLRQSIVGNTPSAPTSNASVAGIRFGNWGSETSHDVYNAAGQIVGTLPFGAGIKITGPAVQEGVAFRDKPGLSAPVGVYPILGPAGTPAFIQTVDVGGWSPITG